VAAAIALLRVYSEEMPEAKRKSTIVGCVSVLCLGVYWAARFVPGFAYVFPLSSFGKFVTFGTFLAGVPLTIIAAVRGSRWWCIAVAASAITLADIYIKFGRVLR
jgi:hypothetical protein